MFYTLYIQIVGNTAEGKRIAKDGYLEEWEPGYYPNTGNDPLEAKHFPSRDAACAMAERLKDHFEYELKYYEVVCFD